MRWLMHSTSVIHNSSHPIMKSFLATKHFIYNFDSFSFPCHSDNVFMSTLNTPHYFIIAKEGRFSLTDENIGSWNIIIIYVMYVMESGGTILITIISISSGGLFICSETLYKNWISW